MYQQDTYPGIDPGVLEHGGVSMVRDAKKCPAKFFIHTKEIVTKDEKTGSVTKTYVDEERIQFMLPGGDTTAAKATDEHRYTYPQEYAAFKRGNENAVTGFCLTRVAWLSPAQIKTYQALNIPNLETLSNAPDNVIQGIMGGLRHREQAREFLAEASGQLPMVQLVAKNEELENTVKMLQEQIKELCARLDQPTETKKGKAKAE